MTDDLTKKSATELAKLIRSRQVSPCEVVSAYLTAIDKTNPALNAIVTVADDLLQQARAAESAVKRGSDLGLLHGVPVTIKDTFATCGLRSTSGSRLFADHIPTRDAQVVARLKSAGAIILGKTNTPEMAIPYETDNPIFGRTNNPFDFTLTPGGSSGGEAAAIAAGLSPAGIGSDLSGSIRVPAHFCGIAGLKPTTGLVSMVGHLPKAEAQLSLGASPGPMARRVEDLALLLTVIAEKEHNGPSDLHSDLKDLQVAFYTDDGLTRVSRETREAVERVAEILIDAGLQVTEQRPPGVSDGTRMWIELFADAARDQIGDIYNGSEAEAGSRVRELLATIGERRTELEEKIATAERHARAIVERSHLRARIIEWMKSRALILAPVGSVPAFKHGSKRVEVGGQEISVFRAFGYSQLFNVLDLPSVAIPVARSGNGLPIGVQIAGRPFAERSVLAAAAIVEEACVRSL